LTQENEKAVARALNQTDSVTHWNSHFSRTIQWHNVHQKKSDRLWRIDTDTRMMDTAHSGYMKTHGCTLDYLVWGDNESLRGW